MKTSRSTCSKAIGILLLEFATGTKFRRILGDVGNAATYDFPVALKVVGGAVDSRVVRKEIDGTLLEAFIQGAKELEQEGVRAITTSCGFLVVFQEELANAVNIPVFTSSLMQVPLVHRMLKKGQKVGIITYDSRVLSERHLRAAGIDPSIPIAVSGLEMLEAGSEGVLRYIPEKYDDWVQEVERHTVLTAKRLVSKNQDIGAIVLECTNLPPYAAAVQEAVGLPVFDIVSLVNLVYNAVVKKKYVAFG